MPNELLPTNIGFGTVVGRFGSAPLIAGDADGLPDFSPASGLTVTFTPSTAAVIDATASPAPVTIEMVPIVCGLDTQGYLVGGDGQRGVKLIATDDTDINPSGWTYSVTFLRGGAKVAAFRDFSMSLPSGTTKDIALTIPVPSSSGVSLSQAQAAEAAAVAAASAASAAAAAAAASAATFVPATVDTLGQATTVGKALAKATDATAAQTAIGATAVGKALVTAASTAAAQTAIGATSIGAALVTAPNATSARTAINAVDKATLGFNPRDYGAVGNGSADDAPAFDAMVAAMNTAGHVTQSKPLAVIVPSGVYNVKAGGIRAIVVSNVTVNVSPDAIFMIQNGPVWTLGDSATTIENFWVMGGQPRTAASDTLAATCPWVYAVNVARVVVDKPKMVRCQIFKGVSNLVLTGITISNHTGSGPPDRHWVEIDTSANSTSAAAGLSLINGSGYAYTPPANPAIPPRPITAVTRLNPLQVTSPTHGLTTGDRVRHGGVAGTTELNGVDATVTVIDANTYTLNGIDGTGFTAYTSGGWASKLLWSWPYDSAVLGIKGHWDTVRISGGLYQHYPWLWSIESTGTVSFVYDEEVVWDYGGKGRFNIALNGGSISNIKVNGGWHFCLNEDWIKITNPGTGSVTDLTVRGHVLGMTGGHFIYDSTSSILNLEVQGLRVMAMGRARIGICYLIRAGVTGNNISTIRGVRCESPSTYYSGGNTYLLPDTGIRATANTRYTVEGNEIYAVTSNYVLASDSISGTRQRTIRNNKCYTGALPEYITTLGVTPPTSATNTTNFSGLTQQIHLRGGTMTAAAKNGLQILSGAGPFSFEVLPGETWSVTYSAAPILVVSYKD